jgi:hypothetical protein
MIETHSIRLRGPWECDVAGASRRIRMPVLRALLIGDNYRERLSCRRKFGCPTCLDPHERVWLVIEISAQSGEAMLNGERLGSFQGCGQSTEFELTGRLKERNELRLDFDFAQRTAGTAALDAATDELLFKDVRLEIRG